MIEIVNNSTGHKDRVSLELVTRTKDFGPFSLSQFSA